MGIVLKNMESKLKDLIYQNVLINDTVINANFMVNTKRPKKKTSSAIVHVLSIFFFNRRGKNTLGGKNEALLQKK